MNTDITNWFGRCCITLVMEICFFNITARQVSSSHNIVNLYKPEHLLFSATRSIGMQALKGSLLRWFKGSVSSLKVLRLDVFYVVREK